MDDNKKLGEVSEEDIKLVKAAEPDDIKEKEPVNLGNEVIDWIESFVFAMFVVILIFTFFFRIVLVDGDSMNDTLTDGDRLIISHINYTPEKDDIVVINSTVLNKTIIKRVIGTAGDHIIVNYNDNTVSVNGEVISNEHIKEAMYNTGRFDEEHKTSDNIYEYDVDEGCIFVMGDNRNHSTDGRYIGLVKTEDVLGKAIFRLYPFETIGGLSK